VIRQATSEPPPGPSTLPSVPHVTHVPHTLKCLLPGTFQN
jgi:hypothetical protein